MKSFYYITLLLLSTQSAFASPTIERIKATQTIKLGYTESAFPLSYFDKEANVPRGYAFEISEKVADFIQEELNLPKLKREYVLTNAQNRWDLHQNGGVDLSCVVNTNTVERQQKFATFSYGYFSTGARMLVPKTSGVNNYNDLKGKVIGVPESAASRNFLVSKKGHFKLKDVSIEPSLAHSFQRLRNGELDGIVYDEVSLASLLFQNPDIANNFDIIGKPMTAENYGCTSQLNDTEFSQLVNQAIGKLIEDKSIITLYEKWFLQPIPPSGRVFNLPMNNATEELLSLPSDQAVGQLN